MATNFDAPVFGPVHGGRSSVSGVRPVSIGYGHLAHRAQIGPSFGTIYAVYERGFPHGARSEAFFRRMMELNESTIVQNQRGPARYQISFAHQNGKVLGTAMYMMIAAPERGWQGSPYDAAVGIDYRSVLPEARGGGIAGELEKQARAQTGLFLAGLGRVHNPDAARILTFNESSMPLRMPLGAYLDDVNLAKTDPRKRVEIWNKAGFRRFLPAPGVPRYIEPASRDKEPACDYYSFNAKTAPGETLGTRMAADLITRYASFRRMDGGEPRTDRDFARMLDQMARLEVLRPIHDAPLLGKVNARVDKFLAALPGDIPEEIAERRLARLMRDNARYAGPALAA